MSEYVIEMLNITKRFPGIVANDNITLQLKRGEIHALLGENGAGKSTLMSVLFGLYQPEEGEIHKDGKKVEIQDPNDANELGIGMVHQHFKLVECFSVLDNIMLGVETTTKGGFLKKDEARKKVVELSEKYGLAVDPDAKIENITVGMQQRTEILKMLYRDNEVLIFDEPTAVLTPQETARLFEVIRNMKADNKSVIIITHKLHEVLEISDRVAILRKGEYIGTVDTCEATENSLTEMMVGKKVELNIARSAPVNPVKRLSVSHLTVYNREDIKVLDDVSFDVYGGEILGIAGISGNGQKELLEAIAGLQITGQGSSIEFYERGKENQPLQLVGKTPKKIRDAGVHLAFVPEDRLGMGLVGSMGMTGNMLLKSYGKGASPLTDMRTPKKMAEKVKEELEVVTPSLNTPVSRLSGGNVQKVLVGREIAEAPTVLMTAYAVRGLDINTSYTIYNLLDEEKKEGVAVVYVGEDLDVLIDLCDRILVLCGGKENGILDARTTTKEEVGLLMTNLRKEGK